MKNLLKITLFATTLIFFTGCETVELELLENPNNISVGSADANFILNDVGEMERSLLNNEYPK